MSVSSSQIQQSPVIAAQGNCERPEEIGMAIQTGMLESLGINMYTSIGKSLVEFVANSYDAEAKKVKILIPFAEIEAARIQLQAQKKSQGHGEGKAVKNHTLPEEVGIEIHDDGHGMTVQDVEKKFLEVNRNRRDAEGNASESGIRQVMGRKGLGKLAGFGVAELVTVRTKRKGETYSTTIEMDYNEMKKCGKIGDVKFKPKYEEGISPDEQGTTITLKRLRSDSLKYKEEAIEDVLSRNFYILGNDFQIYMNDTQVKEPEVDYELIYPSSTERDASTGLALTNVFVSEEFVYPVEYVVKFRARGKSKDGKERGSLPARYRGARIYCNKRLAAGPSLFNLNTATHNFHANAYMECIVKADVLDRQEADLISTNRAGLKTDNEIVDALFDHVTELMRKAIYEHSKYRDSVVAEEVKNDPLSQIVLSAVSAIPERSREPAKQLLMTLAKSEGVDSEVYKQTAPTLVKAINSSEVLVELIKTGINPTDLQTVIGQLTRLADVERSDVLKLYRARRSGIDGLRKLHERSHEGTAKYERELHQLLKENPWLIKPEYGHYVSSDKPTADVVRELTTRLKIDYKSENEDKLTDKRPDLVFLIADSNIPTIVSVVELKSPNVNLNINHLNQLKLYMSEIGETLKTQYGGTHLKVFGHLIGNRARHDTQSDDCKLLEITLNEAGPTAQWEVLSLPVMLDRAKSVHLNTINTLQAEEEAFQE